MADRIVLRLSDEIERRLKQMRALAQVDSNTQLVRDALQLYGLVLDKVVGSKQELAFFDPEKKEMRTVYLGWLSAGEQPKNPEDEMTKLGTEVAERAFAKKPPAQAKGHGTGHLTAGSA